MTRYGHLCACLAGFIALALAGPPLAGAAALRPITGRLDQPGYTVMAVAANGAITAVASPDGRFSLVPPAGTVTLHLRAPDGAYAGPVVLVEPGDKVKDARAGVASAQRKLTKARKAVTSAKRRLAKAHGTKARRTATRRLKAARASVKKVEAQLKRARRVLSETKRQAAEKPNWAILGMRPGTQLGAVTVSTAAGYALTRSLSPRGWKAWVDVTRRAQAKLGVPIGAGNFGLVRSARTDGAAVKDTDVDAVPDSLDVDDDGDLILDDYDRSPASAKARAAQAPATTFADGSRLQVTTSLGARTVEEAVNVNGGSTDAKIAASEQKLGRITLLWVGIDVGTGEIDCGALVYCSAGGTGRFPMTPGTMPGGLDRAASDPFPECCDADKDGLGSLTPGGPISSLPPAGGFGMAIYHGATDAQLQAGDVLIARGTSGGTPLASAATIGFVFSTFPVVASYDDGQGNTRSFTYPASGAPSPVRAGPSGDVVIRFTLWKPQRPRIPSEAGTGRWMDVGNLSYIVYGAASSTQPDCPQSSFSAPSGTLTPLTSSPIPRLDAGAGGFADTAADRPADPANTVSFTLNLTQCGAARGSTVAPNTTTSIGITAVAGGRDENQFFTSSWFDLAIVP